MTAPQPTSSIDPAFAQLVSDLNGPTLPFFVWRRAQMAMQGSDPAGDFFNWLYEVGYSLDPTAVGSSLVQLRDSSLSWWSGRYRLLGDKDAHNLYIGPDGSVLYDGAEVDRSKISFANRCLAFTAGTPPVAVSLQFSDAHDGIHDALLAPGGDDDAFDHVITAFQSIAQSVGTGALPQPHCEGTLAPLSGAMTAADTKVAARLGAYTVEGMTTMAAGDTKVAARLGTYTVEGMTTMAAGDTPSTWNGVYTIYIASDGAAFTVSPVRLTIAAAPGTAIKGVNANAKVVTLDSPIDDSVVTFAANVLTWTTKVDDTNTYSSSLSFFMDGAGLQRFTGTIVLNGQAPVKAWGELAKPLGGQTGFAITTQTLPDAIAGRAYNAILETEGADGSTAWSVSVGTLPEGLNLDAETGAISGTPKSSIISAFIIKASTGTGTSSTDASKALTISVKASDTPAGPDGWTITGTLASILGGLAIPVVLWVIGNRMEAKAQGKEDLKLQAIKDSTQAMSVALKETAAKTTDDLKKFQTKISDLTKNLEQEVKAQAGTKNSVEKLRKSLEALSSDAKKLASEQRKIKQDIDDKVKTATDQATKDLLEKLSKEAEKSAQELENIQQKAEATDGDEKASEGEGEHKAESNKKAQEVAPTLGGKV